MLQVKRWEEIITDTHTHTRQTPRALTQASPEERDSTKPEQQQNMEQKLFIQAPDRQKPSFTFQSADFHPKVIIHTIQVYLLIFHKLN